MELDLIGGKDTVNYDFPEPKLFRVLSLDGGGAKGFYTLGALKEVEALVGCRLCEKFDLIYGTSTGAIIAALLGLGKSADEIERPVPAARRRQSWRVLPSKKTAALEKLAKEVFGGTEVRRVQDRHGHRRDAVGG